MLPLNMPQSILVALNRQGSSSSGHSLTWVCLHILSHFFPSAFDWQLLMLGVNLHSFISLTIEAYFIFCLELSLVLASLCSLSKIAPLLCCVLVLCYSLEAQKEGQYCFSMDYKEGQLASSRKLLTLSLLRLMLRKVSRMFLRLLLAEPAGTLFLATKKQESSQMSPVGMATSPQLMILMIFQRLLAVSEET